MKHGSTLILKIVILLIALTVCAGLVYFPQTEGRATTLDLLSIYADPFIIYMYIASLFFFAALYHAFKLLGYVDKNKIFSHASINAFRNIKYCAATLATFIIGALFYILVITQVLASENDDPAGFFAIGFVLILTSVVIATAAAVFQKLLQNAVDLKSENELTV